MASVATADLDAYIARWHLDENIVDRLRRLTPVELALVTERDLSDARNASAMLNMRCNRYERKPLPGADVCQECEPTVEPATPRRARADKRRANRANKEARLDRLLDSILTPCAEGTVSVLDGLLDMNRPLRTTSAPSESRLDWDAMGPSCDPFRVAPRLAETPCGQRKRESIEAFAWLLEEVLLPSVRATQGARPDAHTGSSPAPVIVDAGCSTGSLILPLAFAFPDARFVGVDVKASSLALLRERAAVAGLSERVSTWEGRIEDYDGECDGIISLHACGGASDAALQLATRCAPVDARAAPFAVSPCCVGALPRGITSLGSKKAGSSGRGAASTWLSEHLLRAADAETRASRLSASRLDEEDDTSTVEAEIFALLAASAGSDGSARQEHAGGGDATRTRQRRSKRVVEIDRLAAMPGDGLGGLMLTVAGQATAATSSLTDVLVGPPDACEGIMCA